MVTTDSTNIYYSITPQCFCSKLCEVITDIAWQLPSRFNNPKNFSNAYKIADYILQQSYITTKMGKNFAAVWQDKLNQHITGKVADAVSQIIKLAKFDVNLSAVVGESLLSAAIISGEEKFIDLIINFKYQDKYLVGGELSALADVSQKRLQLVKQLAITTNAGDRKIISLKLNNIDKGVDHIDLLRKIGTGSSIKLLSSRTNLPEYRRKFAEHKIDQGMLQEFEESYLVRHKEGQQKVSAPIKISADALDSLHGTLAKDMFLLLFGSCKCQNLESQAMQQ